MLISGLFGQVVILLSNKTDLEQKLPDGISFPGAYSPNDPGILFNVYDKPMKKYTAPGGPVKTI
jgi:hypothetical protein